MNEDLLAAYDKMVTGINDAYATARQHLADNNLVAAQAILAGIAQSHARQSVSLRSLLIRRGLLEDEE